MTDIVASYDVRVTLRKGLDEEVEIPTNAKVEALVEEAITEETGLDVNASAIRTDE